MVKKTLLWGSINRYTIGGFILISLANGPGVFRESFWSDDYPGLLDSEGVANHILRDSRPTGVLLFSGIFGLLNSPAQAWILRSLALAALLLIFLFISNRITNSESRIQNPESREIIWIACRVATNVTQNKRLCDQN